MRNNVKYRKLLTGSGKVNREEAKKNKKYQTKSYNLKTMSEDIKKLN